MKEIFLTLIILSLPVLSWASQVKVIIKGTAIDSTIKGNVLLTEENGGLMLRAYIANAPVGLHGFHIHENGSCEEMGQAAGSHYNPDKVEHGLLTKDGHEHSHAGDMGNLAIREDGTGILKVFLPGLSLTEGKYAVAGRSIIVHENIDDFSQPTGNAGARIACGIIEASDIK